ncbi:MAG: hypothetical protein R3E18_04870 [Sphingomonadaceae bacterium]|nr:hypothetical protein [Sphingomonadaceae bacterium]
MKSLLSATLLATGAVLAMPAQAQDQPGDKVNMVIIYGEDECPPSSDDVINVCARKAESERFRIPETLRQSDAPDNVAWTQRVDRYETVGKFGALSCSPTGAGGFTGCTQALVDAAYGEKKEAPGIRFSQLIDAERQDRLSTIDAEAAAEQERVEQIEKQYEARLEAERNAPLPGEEASAPPTDLITPPSEPDSE